MIFTSAALSFIFLGFDTAAAAETNNNSDAIPIHAKYRSHLKCPYADKWLAKGPKQAALELGLDENGRKLQTDTTMEQPVQGSCSFASAWSGPMCMQFAGSAWTEDDMRYRCALESGSTLSFQGCGEAAGWCNKMISDDKHETTAMALSAMADCDQNKMACEAFMSGTFVADEGCTAASSEEGITGQNIFGGDASSSGGVGGPPPGVATGGGASPYGAAAPSGGGGEMKCMIAPGAIGAAHQAGFSKGYSSSCPGTPGQDSPYMWPLRWSAWTDTKNMAYGSDDIVYHHKGKVFYMLDRNWKRSDSTYADGVLRTLGQGPCDDVDGDIMKEGCAKDNDTSVTTMIHREGLMYFISWKEDESNPVQAGETDASKIEQCTMINLAVIGNIRPDWFLDKRGDDTDVQYLGDQHAYYADGDIPKLVKQWRKKDFASQYFVMSMMGNPPNKLENKDDAPTEDSRHWPLILNVPGEGFGDDMLQVYRNHTFLTDEDEDLFMLIENYEALGGVCSDVRSGDNGDVGPPVQEEGHSIPSNLEVDPQSWVSNEYTFSPIWEGSTRVAVGMTTGESVSATAPAGKSVTEVSDRLTVESCYDESTQSMDMSIYFHDIEVGSDGLLPWMSIGYRPSDLCAMTPIDGGSTPIVLVTHESEGSMPEAHTTSLLPEAKAISQSAFETMYSWMTPLEEVEEYSNISLEAPMLSAEIKVARSILVGEDTVSLHFKQAVEGKAEVMHLMYAIGMNSEIGFHTTRGCFEVQATPCGGAGSSDSVDREKITFDLGDKQEEANMAEATKSSASAVSADGVLVLFLLAAVLAL